MIDRKHFIIIDISFVIAIIYLLAKHCLIKASYLFV